METAELYSLYRDCGYKVSTDSRTIPQGAIFFALRGENFDGNDYALGALEAGASYAVVNDDVPFEDARLIRVADPFTALQELAVYHRARLGLRVIGLTGTNGKTTTKELIAAALGAKYRVIATKGNLNNDIGVPLTLLSIDPSTEIAVVEMGANHPDDIAKLVKVCRPDYGLITNVGTAHLLGFGSYEGVFAAKTELYKWLGSRRGSVIFVNTDYPDLAAAARKQACHQWEFGAASMQAALLPVSESEPFLSLKLAGDEVHTKLVGSYNLPNVLAAIAIADYFGVARKDSIAAIEAYTPSNQRSQLVRTGRNTLIVDAYNANPSSMRLAIENLCSLRASDKLALLGDMRELGSASLQEHVEIVRLLTAQQLPSILVGEEFAKALAHCGITPGEGCILASFDSSESLAKHLEDNPVSASTILVKGSRGIRMEKVIPAL